MKKTLTAGLRIMQSWGILAIGLILIFDSDGNLYGTTVSNGGGAACSDSFGDKGCGTVFMLSPSGGDEWIETILYSFNGNIDGSGPFSEVIFDSQGNLYGTTIGGGNAKRPSLRCDFGWGQCERWHRVRDHSVMPDS